MQLVFRLVDDARCIGKYDLVARFVHDADDAPAGGLRFGCDDGQAFTHQGIAEGGFSCIRQADDVDKTRVEGHGAKVRCSWQLAVSPDSYREQSAVGSQQSAVSSQQ